MVEAEAVNAARGCRAWCRRLGDRHRDPHFPSLPSHTAPWGERGAWRRVPGAGAPLYLPRAVLRARQPGPPGMCVPAPDVPSLPGLPAGAPVLGQRTPWAPCGFFCPLTGLTPAPCLPRPLLHLVLYSGLKPGNPDKAGCEEGAQGHTTVAPPFPALARDCTGQDTGPGPCRAGSDPLVGDMMAEAEAWCPKSSLCDCVGTCMLVTLHARVFVSVCVPVGECTLLYLWGNVVMK